ncbi:MAG: type III pantothenate kinase [Clostridia bacterium]|nr:type III pantothenate kinase [Clostridia bacterium]
MILALDIGNTNITIGGFENDKLSFVARISASKTQTADETASKLLSILSLYGVERSSVTGAAVSSVVPPLTSAVVSAVKFVCGVTAMVVGPGVKTGLGIRCDNPASVGSDLICACVAVRELYTYPSIIVDMETATNMMLLDSAGAFAGVSIMPGVMMGLNALADGTAQLPHVSLDAPKTVIGKNTVDCIKSGVVYGNAAMTDGMIDRVCAEFGAELPVYATGAFAPIVVDHCKHDIVSDEHLVLKGLYMIFRKNH